MSKRLFQRKQVSASVGDNKRGVLPWRMFAEKDPYSSGTLSNESQAGSRQRQRKGLSLARKWLRVVKEGVDSGFSAYARARLLPGWSLPFFPPFLQRQQQSGLFGASFSALWPHSSFSSASPWAAKAAAWSGLLLAFFRRQKSDLPSLPRSPKPGWRRW